MCNDLGSQSVQKIQDLLHKLGYPIQVRKVEQTTRTAVEAAETLGVTVGQIVKSLVFCTKQSNQPILVIASGSNRINEKKLGQLLGESIKRPDAAYVREVTGFAIGGIPPVGHEQPMKTFVDKDLLQYDEVYAAAGSPFAIFPVKPGELLAITGGELVDVK